MKDPAGRLVVGLAGEWPTGFEAAWLAQKQPAGVILFSRNVKNYSQLYGLCRFLHELVPDLEIVADHEGGPVSQLAGALGRPPAAWGLGVLDDVGLTARVYEETGRRLRAVGIDRVLAPVADVLTERRNPVIGSRSFGADPTLVARHTVAAVTGLLAAEMRVCLKHWPGHGGSSGDSHLGETGVAKGAVPVPFESGLHAGAGAVMAGHLLVKDQGDPQARIPATLDPEFMADSRKSLGSGHVENLLFYADDVTMGALGPAMKRLGVSIPDALESGLYDPEVLPSAWFEKLADAGCDRFLIRGIPRTAFPLSDVPEGGPVPVVTEPTSRITPEPTFSAGAYAEARQRLWAVAGPGFADPDSELLWLDYARDDRWAVAAGQDAGPGEAGTMATLEAGLEGMFSAVRHGPAPDLPAVPWTRLVVSSHRPLPDLQDLQEMMPNPASRGVCLAMGHPSLQADLEAWLPKGWRVGALYDIALDELPGGGTKI
ncbi:MAG: glycoside hydrolase family 3 N-terminal domain-containing protein [Candidatus Krumholzibacteriota bacterium]